MIVRIPLGKVPQATSNDGLRLAVTTRNAIGNAEQQSVVKAIAAAVAVLESEASMQLVSYAKSEPEKVFRFTAADSASLAPIVAAVQSAKTTPPNGELPAGLLAAAEAAAADNKLALAAHRALTENQGSRDAAVMWVAGADIELLERATRGGYRAKILDEVVKQPQERLVALENNVSSLSERVVALESRDCSPPPDCKAQEKF
jgi:hypothetical protein